MSRPVKRSRWCLNYVALLLVGNRKRGGGLFSSPSPLLFRSKLIFSLLPLLKYAPFFLPPLSQCNSFRICNSFLLSLFTCSFGPAFLFLFYSIVSLVHILLFVFTVFCFRSSFYSRFSSMQICSFFFSLFLRCNCFLF